jgi:NADP-dependent 3-hydroxy acid dehydrogenase YdfG
VDSQAAARRTEAGVTRTAVITGASSGIGEALALELGARGWILALGARRADRLEKVARAACDAGGRAVAIALDVTDPASIDAFWREAESRVGEIDALVSNAGRATLGPLVACSDDALAADVTVNLLAHMWLAKRALPKMIERRRGDLVFVGSDVAVRPKPELAAYTACKTGLEALARALAMETHDYGIRTTVARLGATATEFGSDLPDARRGEAVALWQRWGLHLTLDVVTALRAAKAIADALAIPPSEGGIVLFELLPTPTPAR